MQPANEYSLQQLRLFTDLVHEIQAWPFEMVAFEYLHEAFGSWSLVIRKGGVRTKFVFDGKDRWLSARRLRSRDGDFPPLSDIGGVEVPPGFTAQTFAHIVKSFQPNPA